MPRSPLLTVALATLREAWRGRMLPLWLALLAGVTGLAMFVSQLAVTEGERFRLVWLAVGTRLVAVLIVAFFLAGSVIRERDDKRIEFILATAISRWQYVLGKWIGAVLLALAIAVRISGSDIRFIALLFEAMSALVTCGMSTGITPSLSTAAKLVLILTMLFGRLGPLTAAFALQRRHRPSRYRYPEELVRIG